MPYLNLHYKKIHYSDTPPSSKSPNPSLPPIVLVHGLGSSQNYYLPVIPTLSQAGYRCIALDTTGSARSPYTYVEQSVSSLATDILGALDALQLQRAVVVGHSMAGITVPQFAATSPERVAAVVLLGPVYPSDAARPIFEARIEAVERDGMQAMADTVPYAAVGSRAGPLQHAFIREVLLGQNPAGYVSMCRVIVGAAQDKPVYKNVTCPVLIVAGEEDKSAPLEGCKRLLTEVGTEEAKKKMVVMEGIGHWMAVEDGAGVGKAITGFLEEALGWVVRV